MPEFAQNGIAKESNLKLTMVAVRQPKLYVEKMVLKIHRNNLIVSK